MNISSVKHQTATRQSRREREPLIAVTKATTGRFERSSVGETRTPLRSETRPGLLGYELEAFESVDAPFL